ncbi:MAG: hypothetical protein A2479_01175 [Candidatus Magasanikbacteria bacterium RIFOXYC2_FULL_39_8]|nr:MAG: hypothetical protein A2479_01175 [Candidatus Magasanikbacteria bacterium RIFOXYC2_FULL_39_8]
MFPKNNLNGFTIMEAMVVLGIFSIISLGAASFVIRSNRDTAIIWEQLATQSEGRKVLQEVVNDTRRAEVSSVGSFPLVAAGDYSFTFYANIDEDLLRERVRFWLSGTTLNKSVLKPSGTPLSYSGVESTLELAHNVVNQSEGVPIFTYFDEAYTGTQNSLTQPVSVTDVHVIRVQLELERDPSKAPVPLHVESTVHVRNLKTN